MKTLVNIFSLFLCVTSIQARAEDPYAAAEHVRMDNGLTVVLAHSSTASQVKIKIEVDTGTEAEKKGEWGVAHLLEHVLFRDKELKDEMSYLQLIKENGGSANGSTSYRITNYFASIPPSKADWLLEAMTKMILEPKITDDYVTKEKSTVELERGRPNPLAQGLGFDIFKVFTPKYLHVPDFGETEFGVKSPERYSITEEQLSTPKLTTEQVQKFYDEYYHPENMRVLIAGNFDRTKVMEVLNGKWAKLQAGLAKKLPPEPRATFHDGSYIRSKVWVGTPYVYVGTKIYSLSRNEKEVVESYLGFLSHRLMKEIRNKKGQTYSANPYSNYGGGYGYATVSMQTTPENYYENLDIVRKYLKNEAQGGNISDQQIADAKKLKLDTYKLDGREADDLMNLADNYVAMMKDYNNFESPYSYLSSISVADYRSILKKHFRTNGQYMFNYAPPLFFQYDMVLIDILFAIGSFVVLRRILKRPFAHDRVRWIRKVQYPPLKMLEICAALAIIILFIHVDFFMDIYITEKSLVQSSLFLSSYVSSFLSLWLFFAVAQGVVSFIPRKLMVVENRLVIKSMSYFSSSIHLSDIKSVETVRGIKFPFAITSWAWRVKFRFHWYDPMFWRRGLLVNLNDGRSYYYSVHSAEAVCKELRSFLPTETSNILKAA